MRKFTAWQASTCRMLHAVTHHHRPLAWYSMSRSANYSSRQDKQTQLPICYHRSARITSFVSMKWGNYHSQITENNGKPSVPAWEINLIAYTPGIYITVPAIYVYLCYLLSPNKIGYLILAILSVLHPCAMYSLKSGVVFGRQTSRWQTNSPTVNSLTLGA